MGKRPGPRIRAVLNTPVGDLGNLLSERRGKNVCKAGITIGGGIFGGRLRLWCGIGAETGWERLLGQFRRSRTDRELMESSLFFTHIWQNK